MTKAVWSERTAGEVALNVYHCRGRGHCVSVLWFLHVLWSDANSSNDYFQTFRTFSPNLNSSGLFDSSWAIDVSSKIFGKVIVHASPRSHSHSLSSVSLNAVCFRWCAEETNGRWPHFLEEYLMPHQSMSRIYRRHQPLSPQRDKAGCADSQSTWGTVHCPGYAALI